jgi:hypothetical protein
MFVDDPVFVIIVLVYFLVFNLANISPEVGKFLAKF